MGKLIDVATSHFSSKPVRKVEIPEWEITLYARKMTLDDKSRWLARAGDDQMDFLVYAVIYGITDEKGDAVFDIGDKHKLRNSVDPDVVSKLASFVLDTSKDGEVEKN